MRVDMSDVTISNQGLFVFSLHSDRARSWVSDNVQLEDWNTLGVDAFVVDGYTYAWNIAQGMFNAGLSVE